MCFEDLLSVLRPLISFFFETFTFEFPVGNLDIFFPVPEIGHQILFPQTAFFLGLFSSSLNSAIVGAAFRIRKAGPLNTNKKANLIFDIVNKCGFRKDFQC